MDRGGWIDVHHHGYHAELIAALHSAGVTQMAPGVPLPRWTVADSLHVIAGGAVPYLAQRLELWLPPDGERVLAQEAANSLRHLYYETAQSVAPGTLACLQAVAGDSRVLFGSDYPHMDAAVVASSRQAITEYGRLDLTMVGRDNALALFPQLGAATSAAAR